MKAKDEAVSEDAELLRGRQQVLAVLVTLGGSVLTVAFLGGLPLGGVIVPFIVLILLGVQIFRGTVWARWVLAALIGVGALGNAYSAFGTIGADGILWVVNGGLAVIYGWCAFMLGLSSAVTAFMSAQRAAREASGP